MRYRRLGRTGLMVSEIGFGAEWMERHSAEQCRAALEDLLARLRTDYIDLGMIHFIDQESDCEAAMNGPYIEYVKELKACGKIRHGALPCAACFA